RMRTPVGSSNRSARSSAENSPATAPSGVTFTVCAPAAPTLQKTHATTATDHCKCLSIASSSLTGISVPASKSGGILPPYTPFGTKFLPLRSHIVDGNFLASDHTDTTRVTADSWLLL